LDANLRRKLPSRKLYGDTLSPILHPPVLAPIATPDAALIAYRVRKFFAIPLFDNGPILGLGRSSVTQAAQAHTRTGKLIWI
jgi:hypothetical protein